jgi:hypothetical protein
MMLEEAMVELLWSRPDPSRPPVRGLPRHPALWLSKRKRERARERERVGKREGEREETVAPTTGGARHGPRPASAVTPQPRRVAPRAPPRATMPPPGWTRDVLERGR